MCKSLRSELMNVRPPSQCRDWELFAQPIISSNPLIHLFVTGLFSKFKFGLQKTHTKLAHEIKRIVSRSPRLDAAGLEELETALIGADLGVQMTTQIVEAVKKAYETQGRDGFDLFAIAEGEVERSLAKNEAELLHAPSGPTVV